MKKILFDILVLAVIVSTVVYVYQTYREEVVTHFFGDQPTTLYVGTIPIAVSVADDDLERQQGLSGVEQMGEFAGKLFIFEREDYHGIWMKDMLFPLDIIWLNNEQEVVHIEKNVSPDTYPDSFVPSVPARFVIEVNAFFTQNQGILVGNKVDIPASVLPPDLNPLLQ